MLSFAQPPKSPQQTLRCASCRIRFRGHHWQKLCDTCWRWRMAMWHLAAASRALREIP
jgi:hypothetical protein